MSSTRSIIAPPPFAANALTVIPPTPVAGVSYRDLVAGPASSPDGWPYAERVNSAEWNQIMFQISSLISIIDAKGILGWSSGKDYVEAAIAFGSDGVLYKWIQASGPNNGGPQDPTSAPLYWQTLSSALNTSALPDRYLAGFSLLNNSTTPNTTLDVGPGSARDSTGSVDLKQTSTIRGILQSSGTWTAGDNQNKLDVGARANNTTYHVYSIRKTSDGSSDITYSTSPSAPALQPGYSGFRYINSFRTNASGNIIPFLNRGAWMYYTTPIRDVNVTGQTPGNASNFSLSVPTGLVCEVLVYAEIGGDNCALYLSSPDFPDLTPIGIGATYVGGNSIQAAGGSALEYSGQQQRVITNASAQIRARYTGLGGVANEIRIVTAGYKVNR